MTDDRSEIQDKITDSEWKLHFDEYQEKFYKYRQLFFSLGTIRKLKTFLDELSVLCPSQQHIKQLIAENKRIELWKYLTHIAVDMGFNHSYFNINHTDDSLEKYLNSDKGSMPLIKDCAPLPVADRVNGKTCLSEASPEERQFYKVIAEDRVTKFWIDMAAHFKAPYYGSNHEVDNSVELPCNLILSLDQPFEEFESQLDQQRAIAWQMYKDKKFKKFIYLTDFLRDSEGRKLAIDKLAEKWEKCFKVYELSQQEEYRKKDGTPNFTQIGQNAGLYGYAHKHHIVNRTKDYLMEAERLIESAQALTFPD